MRLHFVQLRLHFGRVREHIVQARLHFGTMHYLIVQVHEHFGSMHYLIVQVRCLIMPARKGSGTEQDEIFTGMDEKNYLYR